MVRRRSTVRVRKGARLERLAFGRRVLKGGGWTAPARASGTSGHSVSLGPLDGEGCSFGATQPGRGRPKYHDRNDEAVPDRRGTDSGGVAQG